MVDSSIGGVMLDCAAGQLGVGLPQVLSARVECPWVFSTVTTVRDGYTLTYREGSEHGELDLSKAEHLDRDTIRRITAKVLRR